MSFGFDVACIAIRLQTRLSFGTGTGCYDEEHPGQPFDQIEALLVHHHQPVAALQASQLEW
jgi:hypothetical protein